MNHKRRFCPKGHDTEALGGRYRDGSCPSCVSLKNKRYRANATNIEKIKAREARTLDARRARQRAWYEKNKDRKQAAARARLEADPEGVRARWREKSRRWYWRNHDHAKEVARRSNQRWCEGHREITRERTRRRKAKYLAGSVELEHLALLMDAQQGLCLYCGSPLSDDLKHLDHRIPISRGGEHVPDNLAWACRPCNISKHDRLYPSEWTSPFIGRDQ